MTDTPDSGWPLVVTYRTIVQHVAPVPGYIGPGWYITKHRCDFCGVGVGTHELLEHALECWESTNADREP